MSPQRRPTQDLVDAVLQLTASEPRYAEPYGPADEELEWFFTLEEASLGLRSNFEDSLMLQRHRRDRTEAYVEAARTRRVIRERPLRMGDPDAGVLQTAYAPRPWPGALRHELGRLAGVVVRLATAKVGLINDHDLKRVEEHVAHALVERRKQDGPEEIARLRETAARYFDHAYGAYRQQRGTTDNLVRGFR